MHLDQYEERKRYNQLTRDEWSLLHEPEIKDSIRAIEASGKSSADFEVELGASCPTPIQFGLSQPFGKIRMSFRISGKFKVYHAGCGPDWAIEFVKDLQQGYFDN